MSKYELAVWPQDKYRFAIYDNVPKHKRAKDVLKANPGVKAAINLAFFALAAIPAQGVKAYDHQADIKIKGKWEYGPRWPDVVGICIDKDGRATVGRVRDDPWEYAACKTVNYLDGKAVTAPNNVPEGLTYYAFTANGDLITLVVSKDNKMTPAAVVQILRSMGAVTILEYDGSWSSQAAWPGVDISPSQQRTCRTWLLIYDREDDKKEDKPVGKYKVTASIGLNIRNAPNGTKVGAYAYGALVSVLEVKDGWGLTNMGWVSMAHLEAVTPVVRATDNGITIQQRIIKAGRKNRPEYANARTHITIHETGNKAKGADAAAHAGYLDSAAGEKDMVSWHYTVDDHSIIQHLLDRESGYHAGDSTGNKTSIGIEICVNEGGDFEMAKRNAAALVRLLMAEHKIPLANVVQHNRWSGKNCPATIRATTGGWAAFLALCEGKKTKPTEDYREAVKARFELDVSTVDYLAAYKYGPDLLRKLATQG